MRIAATLLLGCALLAACTSSHPGSPGPEATDPIAAADGVIAGDAATGDSTWRPGDSARAGDELPTGDGAIGDPGPVHLSCDLGTQTEVATTTVVELHGFLDNADVLAVVDVREPSETATGVIAGALLYPWNSGVLQAQHASLPADRPVFVICASGGRSGPASTFLAANGHTCVYNVTGGMNAWKSHGYPTVSP